MENAARRLVEADLKQVTSLASKPSELVELALDDMNTLSKDPVYRIAMGCWHRLDNRRKVCFVCLAGARLTRAVDLPVDIALRSVEALESMNAKIAYEMRALDWLRTGAVFRTALNLIAAYNLPCKPIVIADLLNNAGVDEDDLNEACEILESSNGEETGVAEYDRLLRPVVAALRDAGY